MNIGAAIKQLRLAKKLTQEELAERANTSKPNISNLERNAQGFSPVILTSLAKALGIKVSEIFQRAEEIDDSHSENPAGATGMPNQSNDHFGDVMKLYERLSPKKRRAMLQFLKAWTDPDE